MGGADRVCQMVRCECPPTGSRLNRDDAKCQVRRRIGRTHLPGSGLRRRGDDSQSGCATPCGPTEHWTFLPGSGLKRRGDDSQSGCATPCAPPGQSLWQTRAGVHRRMRRTSEESA
eukprot:scaffold12578_cov128-Isochrysis_galbana.AAC.5